MVAALLAAIMSWLGLVSQEEALAWPASSVARLGFTYDGNTHAAGTTRSETERSPPSKCDEHITYDAVGCWSNVASVRRNMSLSHAITAYDSRAMLAQVADRGSTAQEHPAGDGRPLTPMLRGSVAANSAIWVRPPLSIPKSQFGTKWGKHASDYGLDAGDSAARAARMSRIRDVHLNPDEVRLGQYGVYDEAFMFRQGEDLLITRTDGTFVSMYPGGSTSSWFQGPEVFPH